MTEVQTHTSAFEQLEMAEIESILSSIRDRIRQVDEKEEAGRETIRGYKERSLAIPICSVRQTHQTDWSEQPVLRDEIVEVFQRKTGRRKKLQPSVVHRIAERIKTSDDQVYFKVVKPEYLRRFSYRRDLALAVRTALVELMEKEPGGSEVDLFDSLKSENFGSSVVIGAIRDFLREHGVDDFIECINGRGEFSDLCQETTREEAKRIYGQLRIQPGYRDPQDLTVLINKRKKDKERSYTLDDVMRVARELGTGKDNWFKPALRKTESQQVISIHDELYQLLLEHFLGVSVLKPGWLSIAEIREAHGLALNVGQLKHLIMKLGPDEANGDVQLRYNENGKRACLLFSPQFIQERVIPELRLKGHIKE